MLNKMALCLMFQCAVISLPVRSNVRIDYCRRPDSIPPISFADTLLPGIRQSVAVVNPINNVSDAMRSQYRAMRQVFDTASSGSLERALRNADLRQYIGAKIGPAEQVLLKQYSVRSDSAALIQYFNEKAHAGKSLFAGLNPEAFVRFSRPENKLSGLGAQVIWDDNPPVPFQAKVLLNGADKLTLGGIPFEFTYNNLASFGGAPKDYYFTGGMFKVNFNREAYLEKLNAKLNTYYDLKKLFLKDMDLEAAMRSFVDQRLSAIRGSIDSVFGQGLQGVLPDGISMEQLVQLDTAQIKNLFAENGELPRLNTATAGLEKYAGAPEQLQSQAKSMAMTKVLALKKELESGEPARAQLARFEKIKSQLDQFINTDESRIRNIKELVPLGGFQRFFLRVQELNIGAFSADVSPSSISGLFMKGAAGSFFNKGKMLMLGAGNRNDGAGMKDAFLEDNIAVNSYAMQFLRIGKGNMDEDHTHATFMNASARNKTAPELNQQFLPRNIFVGTASKQLSLGEYGTIDGEFSKSNTEFAAATNGSNGYAMSQKAAALSFFNDFWQTVSLGLSYAGEVRNLGLSQRAHVAYSGMGYNNPGTPFGTRGSWQYGLDLRRRWKWHKMTTAFRIDARDMNTSFDAGWNSLQYSADVQLRVKRNWSLNTRMMQSSMKSTGSQAPNDGFLTRQVSVNSQLSSFIGEMPVASFLQGGLQQMQFTTAGVRSGSLLVNLNASESLVINSHMLSVNMFYNYDLKQNAVYSNLLNMDASWSYQLFKALSCSSGLTLLDNRGLVRQLGIKHSLNVELIPGVNASLYVDARKNMYSSPLNYLFGTFRSEFSLQYLIR